MIERKQALTHTVVRLMSLAISHNSLWFCRTRCTEKDISWDPGGHEFSIFAEEEY